MEDSRSPPGSPSPLMTMSPERYNQRSTTPGTPPLFASIRPSENTHHGHSHSHSQSQSQSQRDSEVFDKIKQFNHLATSGGGPVSHMAMTKQLERKTADAALRRAMLGREEAEGEMRRYREEVRALRSAVDEGRERERKVGERLETIMVSPISPIHFATTSDV